MPAFKPQKFLTPQQALERLKKYCAYQERNHSEVRTKLLQLGIRGNDLENVMVKLIEQGFLNEERFAVAYAGGKFRMKHWGRNKIEQELKKRGVSTYNINKGMKEIDERDYKKALLLLLRKKAPTLKDKNMFARKQKLSTFLIGKGYEAEIVFAAVNDFYKAE